MGRQLKRWESPRREGRNVKGRGGSARQRQRKKQFQAMRQRLQEQHSDGAPKQTDSTHDNIFGNREGDRFPGFAFGPGANS